VLAELVDIFYERFERNVRREDKWMFKKKRNERKTCTIASTITWVEFAESAYVGEGDGDGQ